VSGNWEFCEASEADVRVFKAGDIEDNWSEPVADGKFAFSLGEPWSQGAVVVEGSGPELWKLADHLVQTLTTEGVPRG
jgi:hypothetical protein